MTRLLALFGIVVSGGGNLVLRHIPHYGVGLNHAPSPCTQAMGLGKYDVEESEIRFTISATDLDVPAQTITFTITPWCCPYPRNW